MQNPFEVLSNRLDSIENLLHSMKGQAETKPAKDEPGNLLNIDQAAEFLHLSRATIYSKCSRKELPYMKRGKRLYFMRDQLLEYLKGGQHETAAQMAENAHQYLVKKKGGQRNG